MSADVESVILATSFALHLDGADEPSHPVCPAHIPHCPIRLHRHQNHTLT
jgi:hypothetical protein